jgi:hypothetical protein
LIVRAGSHNLEAMEVRFTPEQEAELSRMAAQARADLEGLIKDAALGLIEWV